MGRDEKNWTGRKVRRAETFEVLEGSAPDRSPPASAEAEEHVIACCLLDAGDTIGRCLAARLTPDAFYARSGNRLIYELILDLYRTKPPVTLEVLVVELQSRRQLEAVGGMPYLMQVTDKIPTTAHVAYFIEKVKEKWILRELIKDATQAVENCYAFTGAEEHALENLISPLATRFNRAVQYARDGEETMEARAARGYQRTLAKLEGKHDTSRQLFTGLPEFDRRFGAFDVFEEDWLIGVAALTSGGKSAFTRKVADYNLTKGKKGLVFLLETSIAKWLDLAACTSIRLNGRFLHNLTPDQDKAFRAARAEREAWIGERLWIHDDSIKAEILCARVEDHVRQHGAVDFVIVDHLHELYSAANFKGNRESELGYIAKLLKKTAKGLNIPFFVPTQLNRSSAKEAHRRPTKHDIRGSGEIEAAYDRLILLHTPKEDMRGAEQTDNQARVMIEIIQDKSRNGPIGHREFWFDRPFTDYVDIRDHELAKPKPGNPGGEKAAGGYGRT